MRAAAALNNTLGRIVSRRSPRVTELAIRGRSREPSFFVGALGVALIALLLSGCAHTQSAPTTRVSGALALAGVAASASHVAQAGALPANAPAAPFISAHAALFINPATGAVYLTRNADTEVAMASTTKIMTAVVALTAGNLDQRITVGSDATALENGIASVAGLQLGDSLTLRELLYALMLPSGDDAAVVIADGIAGSQAGFVSLMNLEATMLGMRHTHYSDVHGLDAPNHYTTANDLAKLTLYALHFPAFAKTVATATYTLPATANHTNYTWMNTNKLLSTRLYPGVVGVKTGFTGNAGECLVFAATRSTGTLLGVLLGEPSDDARFNDASALLNWGFTIETMSSPAS